MLKSKKRYEIPIKVRYVETDQMGFVHHSNYPIYFEQARVAWLDDLGLHYKKLEEEGTMLPLTSLSVQYKKPAFFGDDLMVKVFISDMSPIKFVFSYEVKNQRDDMICTGETTIVVVDAQTRKLKKAPANLWKAFN